MLYDINNIPCKFYNQFYFFVIWSSIAQPLNKVECLKFENTQHINFLHCTIHGLFYRLKKNKNEIDIEFFIQRTCKKFKNVL